MPVIYELRLPTGGTYLSLTEKGTWGGPFSVAKPREFETRHEAEAIIPTLLPDDPEYRAKIYAQAIQID